MIVRMKNGWCLDADKGGDETECKCENESRNGEGKRENRSENGEIRCV